MSLKRVKTANRNSETILDQVTIDRHPIPGSLIHIARATNSFVDDGDYVSSRRIRCQSLALSCSSSP